MSCAIATNIFFTRQQANFNFDTISSFLEIVYSNIKAYPAAPFAIHTNIMNGIPSLFSKYVPVSHLHKEFLEQILKLVEDS